MLHVWKCDYYLLLSTSHFILTVDKKTLLKNFTILILFSLSRSLSLPCQPNYTPLPRKTCAMNDPLLQSPYIIYKHVNSRRRRRNKILSSHQQLLPYFTYRHKSADQRLLKGYHVVRDTSINGSWFSEDARVQGNRIFMGTLEKKKEREREGSLRGSALFPSFAERYMYPRTWEHEFPCFKKKCGGAV